MAAAVAAEAREVELRPGVAMPRILLGMGEWCCAGGRCGPCLNSTAAAEDVGEAAARGFAGVDTALGYGNQRGVGEAIRRHGLRHFFVQTKVPPCARGQGATACAEATAAALAEDTAELGLGRPIDSVLLHSAPGSAVRGLECGTPAGCALARAQWGVLLSARRRGAVRAVGVSNYCQRCLQCLADGGLEPPALNQLQYHAGMPGADPMGLISDTRRRGIEPQAYSPLGNWRSHSLLTSNLTVAIGRRIGKAAAQVALRWVLQQNVSLVVASAVPAYLAEDQHVWGWTLGAADMVALSDTPFAPEGPTRGACVG